MIGLGPETRLTSPMLDRAVIDALFPADLPEPEYWERRYPSRSLPEGAQITRFGPSPTEFARAFDYFGIRPDEDDEHGAYGPYRQSRRDRIYLTYVRELLRQGRAY